jgi:hypothetical protein
MFVKQNIITSFTFVGFIIIFASYSFSNVLAHEYNIPNSVTLLISKPGAANTEHIYLPLVFSSEENVPPPSPSPTPSPGTHSPKVNAPYFDGDDNFSERAIFWFGQVNPTDNYANVRVGYTAEELLVHLSVFDRLLWYNLTPSSDDLRSWDAVDLYLNLDGNIGNLPGTSAYQFVGQLNWWEDDRENWQAGYRGNGTNWVTSTISFTTTSGWRGNAPNDNTDDRGWTIGYKIPFTSLGLANPPDPGSVWGMALVLHDRDDASGSPIADKSWPEDINTLRPETWGQLSFGLPDFTPPDVSPGGITSIRHKLNGADVPDAHVGGHTVCGQDFWPDFFDGWGDANYAGYEQVNIQNQSDVADWPCYSKYYVTFPLDSIPNGIEIISATLTLHLFGNAGGGSWGDAPDSLIQVLTVAEDWNEAALTWNNAPLGMENVSRTWVYPIDEFPGWPGVPYEWDVSIAAAQAYSDSEPLRLVLYSADSAYHSGKYFISSDTGDWNEVARPSLVVQWGHP